MRKCTNCKAELDDDAKFCVICGTKVEDKKVCKKCGAELTEEALFCSECGTSVGGKQSKKLIYAIAAACSLSVIGII